MLVKTAFNHDAATSNGIAFTFLTVGVNIVICTVICFSMMNRCLGQADEFSLSIIVKILVVLFIPIASAFISVLSVYTMPLVAFTLLLLCSISFLMFLYSLALSEVLERKAQRGPQGQKRGGKARFLEPHRLEGLKLIDAAGISIMVQYQGKESFIILAAIPGFFKIILPGMVNWVYASEQASAAAAGVREVQPERQHAQEERGEAARLPVLFTVEGFGFLDVIVAVTLSTVVQIHDDKYRKTVFVILAVIPVAYNVILTSIFNFFLRSKHAQVVDDEVQR